MSPCPNPSRFRGWPTLSYGGAYRGADAADRFGILRAAAVKSRPPVIDGHARGGRTSHPHSALVGRLRARARLPASAPGRPPVVCRRPWHALMAASAPLCRARRRLGTDASPRALAARAYYSVRATANDLARRGMWCWYRHIPWPSAGSPFRGPATALSTRSSRRRSLWRSRGRPREDNGFDVVSRSTVHGPRPRHRGHTFVVAVWPTTVRFRVHRGR